MPGAQRETLGGGSAEGGREGVAWQGTRTPASAREPIGHSFPTPAAATAKVGRGEEDYWLPGSSERLRACRRACLVPPLSHPVFLRLGSPQLPVFPWGTAVGGTPCASDPTPSSSLRRRACDVSGRRRVSCPEGPPCRGTSRTPARPPGLVTERERSLAGGARRGHGTTLLQ